MKRFSHPQRWAMLSTMAVLCWGTHALAQAPVELPAPLTAQKSQSTAIAYEEAKAPAAGPSCIAGSGCVAKGGCAANGSCDCGDGCGCESTFPLCHQHCDPWALASLFGDDPPVTVGGWMQFGYHSANNGVFNTHPHHLDLQQGWLYIERVADGSKGLSFGGRVDIMYGTDAANTQAFGNNPGRWDFANGWDHGVYGWAMPQLYGEVAWGDVSVKVGHFYTLLGYEVVTAPDNFFYSHAFTMNFSEAFTHTGALATWNASDDVTVYAGWTAGWDTGFDRLNNGSNFLGGASFKIGEDLTVTYITTVGNFGAIQEGYSHSIVADWNISDKWNYVFQTDFIDTNAGFDTIGINQYLFYTVCDTFRLGTRAEWWKANGTSYHEWTVGANYRPMANVIVRPEFRYQWAPGTNDANAFGINVNQGIFAIDTILTF